MYLKWEIVLLKVLFQNTAKRSVITLCKMKLLPSLKPIKFKQKLKHLIVEPSLNFFLLKEIPSKQENPFSNQMNPLKNPLEELLLPPKLPKHLKKPLLKPLLNNSNNNNNKHNNKLLNKLNKHNNLLNNKNKNNKLPLFPLFNLLLK